MAIRLNLSDEIERRLRKRAEDLGVSPEGLASTLLSSSLSDEDSNGAGSQLVELWRSQGLIGYRPDITDPVKHVAKVRKLAAKRDR